VAKGKYQKWLTKDGLTKLKAWARDGLTDEQLAHNMGISAATLYNWKRDHLEILEALKQNKEIADIEVENSLHKSAVGFEYDEVTKEPLFNPNNGEPIKGKDGKQIVATTKIVHKHVLPSNTAQIFWLKNRKPEQWRDKPPEQHGDNKEEDDNFYNAVEDAVKHEV
jgi:DNA-binding XRE family transcriptional regulator